VNNCPLNVQEPLLTDHRSENELPPSCGCYPQYNGPRENSRNPFKGCLKCRIVLIAFAAMILYIGISSWAGGPKTAPGETAPPPVPAAEQRV
jgi:hypothetical protein